MLVSAGATALGVALAWLTVRTDLPGRTVWRVTAVLPLVIPSFVGAAAWRLTFERGGILDDWFGIASFPEMRGLRGATIVLILFTYPYVYLPVAARLASLPPSLEENARILGRSPSYAFWRIVLPQCASAIAAGTLFVALYTVSEFGVGPDPRLRHAHPPAVRQPAPPAGRGDRDGPAARGARARHHDRRAGGGAADPAVGRDRRPPSAARAARTVALAGARGRDRR